MELGFETIGNATVICYDRGPVLVTDPWLVGSAYFGSWILSHEIPEQQMEAMTRCKYVWVSHGHPDHLSVDSLQLLRGKQILLPDHYGGRIHRELEGLGLSGQILPDRTWHDLSDKLRVMCIADYNQDAVLLVDLGGVLFINLNDANDTGWGQFVRETVRGYKTTFLAALSGYGDADMMNFFDEDGHRIPPAAAKKIPPGLDIALRVERYGARFFIPFSSMHRYQRRDSIWANEYTTSLADYPKGFHSKTAEILPAYIRYDCVTGSLEALNPAEVPARVVEPEEFGDNWADPLGRDDMVKISKYFQPIRHLAEIFSHITLRVGGRDYTVGLGGRKKKKSITFEVPRHSLIRAIEWQVFDDLLIGNFMKTTMHGIGRDGVHRSLYPDFSPYVAKYADNGGARTPGELKAYFKAYRRRDPLGFLYHRLGLRVDSFMQNTIGTLFRARVPRGSRTYAAMKRTYRHIVNHES